MAVVLLIDQADFGNGKDLVCHRFVSKGEMVFELFRGRHKPLLGNSEKNHPQNISLTSQ